MSNISDERLEVADALEEFAMIDEAEGGNPLVIATERRAAELLRSPQPAGVRVKGLEWRRDHVHKEWHGNVVVGTGYNYLIKDDGRWCSGPERRWVLDNTGNIEAAKAAAEADYRQRIISALEPQQEEAVAITPHMLNAGTEQITIPSYDADDKKDLAVKVFRAMILARTSTHPTPVQKVQESQTVSEEMVERAHWAYQEYGDQPCDTGSLRAALTAALEPSHDIS